MNIFCIENPSIFDPLVSTTPAHEPLLIWTQNLDVSPMFSKHLCIGTMDSLQCLRSNDYVISIINSNYGVTRTGVFKISSFSHCRQEVALSLTCTHSCVFEYLIPKALSQCGNHTTDYINIGYECIPT
ncbi:unnamed protein product [Rotaria sp. Silwood2]|nr:unnamed protein product [Rotaria sp. Silwood2]CAF4693084.1 unnamed protein product [Rotaria sp. Silwood2]